MSKSTVVLVISVLFVIAFGIEAKLAALTGLSELKVIYYLLWGLGLFAFCCIVVVVRTLGPRVIELKKMERNKS